MLHKNMKKINKTLMEYIKLLLITRLCSLYDRKHICKYIKNIGKIHKYMKNNEHRCPIVLWTMDYLYFS